MAGPPIDLAAMLGGATTSLDRIERQPVYRPSVDTYRLDLWLQGQPLDPPTIPVFAAWLNTVEAVTARGVTVTRVRIEETPPTDYQRHARWLGLWNIAAGETIRYVPRADAPPLPHGTSDYWIIDGRTVVELRFGQAGDLVVLQLVVDPGQARSALAGWSDLMASSVIDGSELA